MNRNSLLLPVLLVLAGMLAAADVQAQSKVGTTAAQFLGIPVGTRASGMGGAFVAMADDPTSLYWNPGAAALIPHNQAGFMNQNWLVGTKFRWVGAVMNLEGSSAIGLSLTQLDYGDEEVTTVLNPEGTGEIWSAADYAFTLTYARKLTDRFSIGGSIKYINQRIMNESGNTFALDLGLIFVTGFNDMRLGMSITNFGGDIQLDGRDLIIPIDIDKDNTGSNKTLTGKMKTDSWPIPLYFRVGVAMDLVKSDMLTATVAVDAVRPTDNKESLNVGAELAVMNIVYLRGGYRSLFRDDAEEGLTLGAGLRWDINGVAAVGFDYSYQDFGVFKNVNAIGIAVTF